MSVKDEKVRGQRRRRDWNDIRGCLLLGQVSGNVGPSEHGEVSVESGACGWQQLVMEITSPQAGSRLEEQNLEIINTSCFLALLRGLGDCWQFYTNPRQTFSKECHCTLCPG